MNTVATANALKKLKGWIFNKNYLSSIIAQSPNAHSKLYINTLGDSWTCISDDVVYSVKTWDSLVRYMIKEEQMPVALLWSRRVYSDKLELRLPSALERAIESALCGEVASSGAERRGEECDFWICPNCSEINELTAMYCRKCLDIENFDKLDIRNPLDESSKIERSRMFLLIC
eukprot:TRINITY_DN10658_c0_g1_i1.p1 TRINITY_DN10658_c0_g1~~TRINITY_DN10658_c0_g1_i1.p1  ORF type:complete len:174 (-),score=27.08 TRINITY_DN10658_c0_g1_i1:455-976(-)